MLEYIFVPKNLALRVLSDSVPWQEAETIITLISIADQREPVEKLNDSCKYIARLQEIKGRGDIKNTPFHKYGFMLNEVFLPYVMNLQTTYEKTMIFSYTLHHLCNPMFYPKRHKHVEGLNEYPVKMWRMPRHMLIRWRYSCKMPMHKNSLTKKRHFPTEEFFPPCSIDETIQEFATLTNRFFDIMCQCDESSVNYGFACYVYFFAHDRLVHMMKSNEQSTSTMRFIGQLAHCVRQCVLVDQPPTKAVDMLVGMFRTVLPAFVYSSMPFSAYSTARFYKEH